LPKRLLRVINATAATHGDHVDLIPVSVYWGRAPGKEMSRLGLIFGEGWTIAGPVRRLLSTFVNGRQTLVRFGDPIPVAALSSEATPERSARRALRQLRQEFRHARSAVLGPDLALRRSIVAATLGRRAVRAAVALEIRSGKKTRREVLLDARKYALEIAADYSPRAVALMWNPFTWLWNRLYDGVDVLHGERLELASSGAQVVYVPSHRSHMDYLLLSYVIYGRGFAVPHIAAGINLNLPLIGRVLRKCGAFYVRRSFRGHPLYPVVFMSYLGVMMRRGHPIEYFIEGGRSRTGRLLKPKTGMLAMTVRSYLSDPSRPVVFVPVYFGYEKLVEAETYVGELSGRPKQKESILGLIGALRILKRRYGRVYVSFGEPLDLRGHLDRVAPNWQAAAADSKPEWLSSAVSELADEVQRRVNAAVAISPAGLISMVLLATPRQAMVEADLIRQLDLCCELALRLPYSPDATCAQMVGDHVIAHAVELGMLAREPHPLGTVVRLTATSAATASYYRNGILHAYALPSLIACAFLNNAALRTEDIHRLAWRIYPYVAAEMFLRWSEEELSGAVNDVLAVLADLKLLERDPDSTLWRRPLTGSSEAVQLSTLAHTTLEVIERYYLAIALLLKAGSGEMTQEALEKRCQLMASRMALLYELRSPEFFDRGLFGQFISLLQERQVLGRDALGRLTYDAELLAVAADARIVLSEQIRHSVLQVTHG
jgi:glycerol-3-phosphate O-acyltransferase